MTILATTDQMERNEILILDHAQSLRRIDDKYKGMEGITVLVHNWYRLQERVSIMDCEALVYERVLRMQTATVDPPTTHLGMTRTDFSSYNTSLHLVSSVNHVMPAFPINHLWPLVLRKFRETSERGGRLLQLHIYIRVAASELNKISILFFASQNIMVLSLSYFQTSSRIEARLAPATMTVEECSSVAGWPAASIYQTPFFAILTGIRHI